MKRSSISLCRLWPCFKLSRKNVRIYIYNKSGNKAIKEPFLSIFFEGLSLIILFQTSNFFLLTFFVHSLNPTRSISCSVPFMGYTMLMLSCPKTCMQKSKYNIGNSCAWHRESRSVTLLFSYGMSSHLPTLLNYIIFFSFSQLSFIITNIYSGKYNHNETFIIIKCSGIHISSCILNFAAKSTNKLQTIQNK